MTYRQNGRARKQTGAPKRVKKKVTFIASLKVNYFISIKLIFGST